MAGALSHSSSVSHSTRSNPSRRLTIRYRYSPMIITMAQSQSYWTDINSNIEAHLKKSIPVRPPLSVFEPMHHLTFTTPQTTASALCVAACELVGGRLEDAIDAASAIHLMHVAAVTHKNLPLTDGPMGRLAVPHSFGPNVELLTGDGIVPFGFELLAKSMNGDRGKADKILRVMIEISRAVGSQGMVAGQYRELNGVESDGRELIEYVCEKKEGELHACGSACGAILGGGSEDEIEKLRKYGLYVGMMRGVMDWEGKNVNVGGKMKIVEKLRGLAMKELEFFGSRKVEANLCNVLK